MIIYLMAILGAAAGCAIADVLSRRKKNKLLQKELEHRFYTESAHTWLERKQNADKWSEQVLSNFNKSLK